MLELEPPTPRVAVKNVSINEPFFAATGREPIMPGVLIVEALAQAAGVLIAASIESPRTKVALIASIDGVKLRRPVVPGDQLRLEVLSHGSRTSSACVSGQAKVGETLAAEAQFRFVIMEADRVAGSADGVPCVVSSARARRAVNGTAGSIGHSSRNHRAKG